MHVRCVFIPAITVLFKVTLIVGGLLVLPQKFLHMDAISLVNFVLNVGQRNDWFEVETNTTNDRMWSKIKLK